MNIDTAWSAGTGLMLLLGLRHGLDPDHVAVIDALTLQSSKSRPGLAPWTGTLFSLGHGMVITAIAVMVSLASVSVTLPPLLHEVAGWLPVVLLAGIGLANLGSLLRATDAAAPPPALRLVGPLARTAHPLGVVAVGIVFALVFDTASQAAAWGYVATAHGGTTAALAAGIAFTAGMMITDTLDSRVLFGILRNAEQGSVRRFRRTLGWTIVVLSLVMAAGGAMIRLSPELMPRPETWTLLGAALLLPVVAIYAWTLWGLRTRT